MLFLPFRQSSEQLLERQTHPSPGHWPGFWVWFFEIGREKCFALSGRRLILINTLGDAQGYAVFALQAKF